MSERKYKKGALIKTPEALVSEIEKGNFIYLDGKLYHPGWTAGMPLRYLSLVARHGRAWKAVKL